MTTDAVVLAEGVGRLSAVGMAIPILEVATQTSGAAGSLAAEWTLGTTIVDTRGHEGEFIPGWPMSLSQTLGNNAASTYVVLLGPVIDGAIQVQATVSGGMNYQAVLADTEAISSVLTPAWARSLAAELGSGAALTPALAVLTLGQLGITDTVTPTMSYRTIVAQAVSQSALLTQFFGGSLAGGIGELAEMAVLPRFDRVMLGGLGEQASLSNLLILRVVITDTRVSDDTDIPSMVFRPTLSAGIEISAAHIFPDGTTTTWVVNSRTGAVTEYQNFAFNSFARMGHKYLGASSSGLYELNGDDDAGTDIVSRIRSGFAQFGASRFSGFKAAYLGIRATGDLVFRLVYADDTVTSYAVKARDMETVKVQLGKGVRARYIAYELESTGQDFDLESVELVPMVAQRRV